uniref:Uncharacterized protein n=1 Tax=Aegilops tauschii TaxID=37682 RepID=R7WDI7_AEGTA
MTNTTSQARFDLYPDKGGAPRPAASIPKPPTPTHKTSDPILTTTSCVSLIENTIPKRVRWEDLPWEDDGCDAYLVFDPAESLHYQVFSVPRELEKVVLKPHDELEEDFIRWPPSIWTLDVFSSSTRQWEKRSFVREAEAPETMTDARLDLLDPLSMSWSRQTGSCSVYWRGSLYVNFYGVFVVRLSFSNGKYRVIKTPVNDEESIHVHSYVGKSEHGVYFATVHDGCRLQVWTLMESSERVDWVSKKHIDLGNATLPLCQPDYMEGTGKTWILDDDDDVNGNSRDIRRENLDWDSDDDNIVNIEDSSYHYSHTYVSFLGEISINYYFFLNFSINYYFVLEKVLVRQSHNASDDSEGKMIISLLVKRRGSSTELVDHCGGLLLHRDWRTLCVINPATRRWEDLPWEDDGCDAYLAFDPAESLHYQVFSVPSDPEKVVLNPHDEFEEDLIECPPSTWTINVFSSSTRQWQRRSFVREAEAPETVLHPISMPWSRQRGRRSVYWRGSLYAHFYGVFLVRLSLSNGKYRVIKTPINDEESIHSYVGRSENGVYFATVHDGCRLQVWTLMESSERVDWVSKKHIDLGTATLPLYPPDYMEGIEKTWILDDDDDVNGNNRNIKTENLDWDSDDDNIVNIEDSSCQYSHTYVSFLGFHPYKEVVFLALTSYEGPVAVAYHLNSSKFQGDNQQPFRFSSIKLLQLYDPMSTGFLQNFFRQKFETSSFGIAKELLMTALAVQGERNAKKENKIAGEKRTYDYINRVVITLPLTVYEDLSATGMRHMVVALFYGMPSPCNCFTLSLSGSDSRRSNSWQDDNDATMEIKVSRRDKGMIPKLFVMLKSTKLEIKNQVLMVDKTTSFKKRAKGRRGTSKKNGKQVAAQVKRTKSGPKPETKVLLLQRDWSLEAELPQVFGG